MSYVKIGSEQRALSDASEQWINEQLRRRKQDGAPICVQVHLKFGAIDVLLATSDCPSGFGGGRPARPQERDVLDLWAKRGLNDPGFTGGNLIAFLKQVMQSA